MMNRRFQLEDVEGATTAEPEWRRAQIECFVPLLEAGQRQNLEEHSRVGDPRFAQNLVGGLSGWHGAM